MLDIVVYAPTVLLYWNVIFLHISTHKHGSICQWEQYWKLEILILSNNWLLSQGLFYREFHSFLFLFILFIPIPVFVFYVSQTQWVRNVCISHKERFSSYASLNDLWKAKFNADVFSVVQLVWVSKLIRVVLFCFVFFFMENVLLTWILFAKGKAIYLLAHTLFR